MTRASKPTRIGLDYRPALVNREGIGRYVRGLVRGFDELTRAVAGSAGAAPDLPVLGLFGWTLAGARFSSSELGLAGGDPRLSRWRVPSGPALRVLERLKRGVDDVPRAAGGLGRLDLFHHTQYRFVPARRARVVCTLHDLCFLDSAEFVDPQTSQRMSRFARHAAERADAICVPTQHVAREVSSRLGVDSERVFVTPLGCDHIELRDAGARSAAPGEPATVLTVSRVDTRKNHVGALRALECLTRRGRRVRWIVAGSAGHGHEAFAEALERTSASVEWRRDVPEDELLTLFDLAGVYLAPALEEGFGLTPLEAARRGLPVVASASPVAREVLGEGALFAEAGDPEGLADALEQALDGDPRRAELIEAGRERSQLFSWRRTAEATLVAWRAALTGPGREA